MAFFGAPFEGSELECLRFDVDEDAEPMRLEHLTSVQVLSPEVEALVEAVGDRVVGDVLRVGNEIVAHELLEIELEFFVLLDAIENVTVYLSEVVFQGRQEFEDIHNRVDVCLQVFTGRR